ncbi:MobQ family relaxase [Pseudoflavonifractor sp. 60]|uniref:MobQ family relaxase n=1 Tax=Pseudoflavonifractor sp. 60 TaxID=2304576 RepID=UPI00191BFA7A|nr:MobQ family relaxase [Pseudoflavonifractor sp. 60]
MRRKEENHIAIFHCPIQIIKRSVGRSTVAAAAYRSGERLTNEWDGKTHDYTHKPGVVHTEIMLPAHAPPEFQDRSTLWNSVEQIEKASDAQLAREIEVALPVELSRTEQLALVRSFVKDNFVAEGMCADFALHDKGDGNPHAHILLTIRPLKPDGRWGPKCRKVYDLDSKGNRIPDGKGGWKNHREDTTDWNNRDNAEKWRAAWAAYANRALEAAGRPERIDHRSYERQGIDKIPSIHMGVAASQMERKGIQTEKGNVNRQIAADNKLLKELKARITRIYNWTKEQAQAEQPQDGGSLVTRLYEAQAEVNRNKARYRSGRIKALQENAKLLAFLQGNGITSMQELYEKVTAMNKDYYDLRGQIVKAERRLAVLDERLEMCAQYDRCKAVRQKLDKVKPRKREQYQQEHRAELAGFEAAERFLKDLKASGEAITPKAWRAEAARLTMQKDADYQKMRDMRDEIKAVEALRKTADRLAHEGQHQQKENER